MARYGEVSWEDDYGNGGGDKKSNTKDLWLRLGNGSNRVRLVTRPFQYVVHKGVKKKGDKGFGQKVNCANPDGKGSCPLCDAGLTASSRWLLGVVETTGNTYKVLDIPYQVFSQIKKLNKQQDIWGDPTKYDIDIVVDRDGGPTGYYSVQPIPHKPLSPDAQKAKDSADVEYLKSRTVPPSAEVVQRRMDKILEGQALHIPPAQPKNGAAPAVKGKGAAKVVVEEDNVDDIFPSYDADEASA